MERLIVLIVAICACIGGALAQDSEPDGQFTAQWESQPQARDFARAYPRRALDSGIPGLVHLCCTPNADRRLACEVGVEWPQNERFGDAALRAARGFRLSEESYAALQAAPSRAFQLAIRWEVLPLRAGFDEIAARVQADAADLCGPGTGPAPDYIVVSAQSMGLRLERRH